MNNATHNKIAHWILEQEVSRGIKSADIREIGKMIFGLELTARDIKKIKEALEGLGYDRILDAKFNDEKYIVYLNREPYYTAHSYDEAMRVESELYSCNDEDFERYYGSYPDVEIKKVKDSIKDSKFRDERLEPTAENAWRHLSQYRYKYGSYMDAFLEMVFRFKLNNYEINALINRAFDREYIDEYEVEKCKNYVKDVFDKNGNIKGELLRAFLGDAKLTRRQKLWYAEELEKFIHPQYLRKNYQLRRLKRRVK